jgi:hypothetical protein
MNQVRPATSTHECTHAHTLPSLPCAAHRRDRRADGPGLAGRTRGLHGRQQHANSPRPSLYPDRLAFWRARLCRAAGGAAVFTNAAAARGPGGYPEWGWRLCGLKQRNSRSCRNASDPLLHLARAVLAGILKGWLALGFTRDDARTLLVGYIEPSLRDRTLLDR